MYISIWYHRFKICNSIDSPTFMSMRWFRILDLSSELFWCQGEVKQKKHTNPGNIQCLTVFFGQASGGFLHNGGLQTSCYINLVGEKVVPAPAKASLWSPFRVWSIWSCHDQHHVTWLKAWGQGQDRTTRDRLWRTHETKLRNFFLMVWPQQLAMYSS